MISIYNGDEKVSLVERVFYHPDRVNEDNCLTIDDFLLSPDSCDDPEMVAEVLQEFKGWAEYMLGQLEQSGIVKNE